MKVYRLGERRESGGTELRDSKSSGQESSLLRRFPGSAEVRGSVVLKALCYTKVPGSRPDEVN
jgi:hypothetical protein